MGTGAATGVPSFYCGCKACEEVSHNPRARRTCSSILISGGANNGERSAASSGASNDESSAACSGENTLIDASPELALQAQREGISRIDRVLFTHEHHDHVGGIAQLEWLVRLSQKEPIALYGGEQTLAFIEQHYDFMRNTYVLSAINAGKPRIFDEVAYTPLLAKHSPGAFGFLIEPELSGRKIAYFPDTAVPSEDVLAALEGIDIFIIDATFNGRVWMPDSHLNIDGAIELSQRIGAKQTYLTHLSMHYDEPITMAELEERLSSHDNISAAFDGLKIEI
jgi:phosphoribosyl 1,2-cyclic phosphate phosphodiesterase